ncbi:MAG: TRAP transporter small permease [Cyclobacteriaceae bacterium]|nr:TRAP transporter small permease [Cyclobacteriaceae bacterium]
MRKIADQIVEKTLILLLGLMLLQVVWQVFSRYILLVPSSFTDELSRFLLIWISLLGASYATGKRMHLTIDLLPNYLSGRKKKNLDLLIHFLVILFALFVMVIGGIRLVYITLTLGQTSSSLEIPLGYIYLIIPLSGILIIFYSILNLLEDPSKSPL